MTDPEPTTAAASEPAAAANEQANEVLSTPKKIKRRQQSSAQPAQQAERTHKSAKTARQKTPSGGQDGGGTDGNVMPDLARRASQAARRISRPGRSPAKAAPTIAKAAKPYKIRRKVQQHQPSLQPAAAKTGASELRCAEAAGCLAIRRAAQSLAQHACKQSDAPRAAACNGSKPGLGDANPEPSADQQVEATSERCAKPRA